jgi:hypothetical protein
MKEALNDDMRQRVLQALAQRAERLPSGGLHDALREALRQRHARLGRARARRGSRRSTQARRRRRSAAAPRRSPSCWPDCRRRATPPA